MLAHPVWIVDAFVGCLLDKPLLGNPAAVVFLDPEEERTLSDEWRLSVAAEMNLAETAFVSPRRDGSYSLRWFTPTTEVDLCGHATLAAAHVLATNGWWDSGLRLSFRTRSGILTAAKQPVGGLLDRSLDRRAGGVERFVLDFPAQAVLPCEMPDELARALGLGAVDVHFDKWFKCFKTSDDWLVEMHPHLVPRISPDFRALGTVSAELKLRGVIVTGWSDGTLEQTGYHFVSRFFAPAIGVDEDPVTGSAHTKLAPFWAERKGMHSMLGWQASARGGLVSVKLEGARVLLSGAARTALRGELLV